MNTIYIIAGLMVASAGFFGYIIHRIMKAQVDAQKALTKAAMEKAEQIQKDRDFVTELEIARKAREFDNQKKQEAEMKKIDDGDRDTFSNETF